MQNQRLWAGCLVLFIAGCSSTPQRHAHKPKPLAPVYQGVITEIPGVVPKYEPLSTSGNQDYQLKGKNYHIITHPENFSQTGLATHYGSKANGNKTTSGERFNPLLYTAAHATLPIPSYVRVTNLANGRQLVVRINDRGPFIKGRIIDLSPAAADRLNISGRSRVRVDYIQVAADGSLSGPGSIGTRVAIVNYKLPPPPQLTATDKGSAATATIEQSAPP